jgi:diguanylate cyclase (GGDEF)-like protein
LSRGSEVLGVVLVLHDVTENRSMARQLSYQAAHDALTGLINRREFEARLQSALVSARYENERHALCYLDMDQFKIVNDTCSHSAGDKLLKDVAGILQDCLRESDILAGSAGTIQHTLKNCMLEDAMEITENMLAMIRTINDSRAEVRSQRQHRDFGARPRFGKHHGGHETGGPCLLRGQGSRAQPYPYLPDR